jgi:lipopolysaccharide export system permease protein
VRILWRYLGLSWLRAFAGTLFGLTAIYLVVDYIDNARRYHGEDALRWVLELYANKAVTVAYELLPGAMLLAAGITAAGMRKRGEWAALRSLAIGPAHVFGPLAVAAALVALTVAVDGAAVRRASRRVDEIHSTGSSTPAAGRRTSARCAGSGGGATSTTCATATPRRASRT